MSVELVKEIYHTEFVLLKNVNLFDKFGDSALVQIFVSMEPMQYDGPSRKSPRGEKILAEDNPNTGIFVIMSGNCFSRLSGSNRDHLLTAGDYFGERSALSMGDGADPRASEITVWARGTEEKFRDPDKLPDKLPRHPDRAEEEEWDESSPLTTTHIRVLPGAVLKKIFGDFPDLAHKMHNTVDTKKLCETEHKRKNDIRENFFPSEDRINTAFEDQLAKPQQTPRPKEGELTPQDVVEILKPHRKKLISDTRPEDEYNRFVLDYFDNDKSGTVSRAEFHKGIEQLRRKAKNGLGQRRKHSVPVTTDGRLSALDKKVDALDKKLERLDKVQEDTLGKVDEILRTLRTLRNMAD
eukprot:COSAG01_NODE_1503_length_10093_cov_8.276010_7_plen_353_part_00